MFDVLVEFNVQFCPAVSVLHRDGLIHINGFSPITWNHYSSKQPFYLIHGCSYD